MSRCPASVDPGRHSLAILFKWKSKENGTSCTFTHWAGKVSSLRLVFLLSSEDSWTWDLREPVAVEPSPCPSKFQDLAESGPLFQSGNAS